MDSNSDSSWWSSSSSSLPEAIATADVDSNSDSSWWQQQVSVSSWWSSWWSSSSSSLPEAIAIAESVQSTPPKKRFKSKDNADVSTSELLETIVYTAPPPHQDLPVDDDGRPEYGPSPSGTLKIYKLSSDRGVIPGYESHESYIKLEYNMPDGIQAVYHQNPHQPFQGDACRVAFLPHDDLGIELKERIKYAFTKGLIFTIGYSHSKKKDNVVVWRTVEVSKRLGLKKALVAAVPHKTTLKANAEFGYPDPNYFTECNQALDRAFQTIGRRMKVHTVQVSNGNSIAPVAEVHVIQDNDDNSHSYDSIDMNLNYELHYQALSNKPQCYGKSPTASMKFISVSPKEKHLAGYDKEVGTIVIEYRVEDGIQMEFHPSPQRRYTGTSRYTYLPNTQDGRKLAYRLGYAFSWGHIFNVGTSISRGVKNTTVWSTMIPHKTVTSGGGEFGYPDKDYIERCNQALDKLNIPTS